MGHRAVRRGRSGSCRRGRSVEVQVPLRGGRTAFRVPRKKCYHVFRAHYTLGGGYVSCGRWGYFFHFFLRYFSENKGIFLKNFFALRQRGAAEVQPTLSHPMSTACRLARCSALAMSHATWAGRVYCVLATSHKAVDLSLGIVLGIVAADRVSTCMAHSIGATLLPISTL